MHGEGTQFLRRPDQGSGGDVMISLIKYIMNDKRGVTAIEYGLIAGFIVILIIAGVKSVGTSVSTMYGNVSTSM